MKILQKIWDWIFRLVCYGFEPETSIKSESSLLQDYELKLRQFRRAAQAVIADHYRLKIQLDDEIARQGQLQAQPVTEAVEQELLGSMQRIEDLQSRVDSSASDAARALEHLQELSEELESAAAKIEDAEIAKRAAQLRLAVEDWRMENVLGLNKLSVEVQQLQIEARHAEIKAELTGQSNDSLLGNQDSEVSEQGKVTD